MRATAATAARVSGLGWFGQVERFLASFLLIAPAVIWLVDDPSDPRGSISAYHDMVEAQWFYVPLTVVAMLFVVNGLVRKAHEYNVALGGALVGLILLNHDGGTSDAHDVFTFLFFVGNVVVVLTLSEIKWSVLKPAILATMLVVWISNRATGFPSVFFAEWITMGVLAGHYVLDSLPTKRYEAFGRGRLPQVQFRPRKPAV